ncbi:MAG: MATE family efflux transporter [Bacteroidetes bacterium 4572_114]|nr:MAG: MATE family efflux transporter [Bacteroidetes bacterium 4572_114]
MKQIFKDIKEAIAGTDQDFTEGKLGRAIFLLSIPMVLEMVMESIFAVVDIYFVSRLGADAIATVGITESLITLIYAVAIGLSMATAALVARRIGEKKHETAANAAFQGIFAGFLISLIIAVPGAIMIGGNMVIMLLFIINAVFRSAGDAAISMRVLWLANSINLVLDPILIFGWGPFPELGIAGAAIATNIGRGIAVAYQLHLLFRGNGRVKLIGDKIKVDLTVMTKLIRISLGGIGQNIIAMSSWIAMVRIVSVFGSEVVAGYTIAVRIIIFSLLPSWGIGNAAATLVGQNLGAKKPDRAEKSVWMTGRVNLILLGSIGAIFVLIPEFFVRLFIADPAVLIPGAQCLRIISIGFLAYGFGMVLIQSFNGAGDTRTPTWINFICFWVIEIPLAYWLAISVGIGEQGVFYAIVIAETILTVLAFIVFKKGRWKENKV